MFFRGPSFNLLHLFSSRSPLKSHPQAGAGAPAEPRESTRGDVGFNGSAGLSWWVGWGVAARGGPGSPGSWVSGCLEARVSVTCDPVEFTHPGGITQIPRFSLQTSRLAEEASRATCQQTAKADFTDLIRNPLKISPGIQHSQCIQRRS